MSGVFIFNRPLSVFTVPGWSWKSSESFVTSSEALSGDLWEAIRPFTFAVCVRSWWSQVERHLNTSAGPPFTAPQKPFPWRHQVQSWPGCGSCHPVLCFTRNLIFIELQFLLSTWTRTEELKDVGLIRPKLSIFDAVVQLWNTWEESTVISVHLQ